VAGAAVVVFVVPVADIEGRVGEDQVDAAIVDFLQSGNAVLVVYRVGTDRHSRSFQSISSRLSSGKTHGDAILPRSHGKTSKGVADGGRSPRPTV